VSGCCFVVFLVAFVCVGPWGVLCNLLIVFYKSRENSFKKKINKIRKVHEIFKKQS
jgi:hypothetical protein